MREEESWKLDEAGVRWSQLLCAGRRQLSTRVSVLGELAAGQWMQLAAVLCRHDARCCPRLCGRGPLVAA